MAKQQELEGQMAKLLAIMEQQQQRQEQPATGHREQQQELGQRQQQQLETVWRQQQQQWEELGARLSATEGQMETLHKGMATTTTFMGQLGARLTARGTSGCLAEGGGYNDSRGRMCKGCRGVCGCAADVPPSPGRGAFGRPAGLPTGGTGEVL